MAGPRIDDIVVRGPPATFTWKDGSCRGRAAVKRRLRIPSSLTEPRPLRRASSSLPEGGSAYKGQATVRALQAAVRQGRYLRRGRLAAARRADLAVIDKGPWDPRLAEVRKWPHTHAAEVLRASTGCWPPARAPGPSAGLDELDAAARALITYRSALRRGPSGGYFDSIVSMLTRSGASMCMALRLRACQ